MVDMIAELIGGMAKGLIQAFGCAIAAISVICIGTKAVDPVGRNQSASGQILVQSILNMALAETIAFYALLFSRKFCMVNFDNFLGKFRMDWHLLLVQSLIFLFISFLLYKFGFKCVIEAMAERREKSGMWIGICRVNAKGSGPL
jgi:F0F1-type ATP synthase membrane subunit c/vacuolar-type H+-ATPase subunit K